MLQTRSLIQAMDPFQSLFILLAISRASMQFDRIDNWAASISDYSKYYKFMSITELFLCNRTASLSDIHRLVKSLNAKSIYCNVNLIDVTPFAHNSKNMAKVLSSINFERHPIMLVDVECAFTPALLKLVNFASFEVLVSSAKNNLFNLKSRLFQASQLQMFNHHFQWLFIDESVEHDDKIASQSESIVELLSALKLNISISTQIVLFKTTTMTTIFLFDVWCILS